MASLNQVHLMGNLTRDVETKQTPSGTLVAQFGLAMNRKFRDSKTNALRDETTFVDIDVWGKQAENAAKYLSKGRPVFIEGRLKLDQWVDKTTGQKRQKLHVVAERIQFMPGGGGAGQNNTVGATQGQVDPQPSSDMADSVHEDIEVTEESVPF